MGQVYQCWWRICREINVLPRLKYPFVTYLLTLPLIYIWYIQTFRISVRLPIDIISYFIS
jgi:hypothetical protein